MKEIKYVFVGKAKDFNAFNITVQTIKKMEVNEKNEKMVDACLILWMKLNVITRVAPVLLPCKSVWPVKMPGSVCSSLLSRGKSAMN